MIEMVYGVEAVLIMNETLCDMYLQKGACPRLLLGEVGKGDAINKLDGTVDQNDDFFRQLVQADLPEEELEAALREGKFNGTTLTLSEAAIRQVAAVEAEMLPNSTIPEVIADFENIFYNPPKITKRAMLEEMCSYDVAVVSVIAELVQRFAFSIDTVPNATVLADLVPYPGWTQNTETDHDIYLKGNTGNNSGCNLGPNGDIFEFFTWGQSRFASLDMLMTPDASDGVMSEGKVANIE